MKSPDELAARLARQWDDANLREERLLSSDAWPVILSISKPSPASLETHLGVVRAHIEAWREVQIGEVHWEFLRFRKLHDPVELPISWTLRKPSDWISASKSAAVQAEFRRLSSLVAASPPLFHALLIRQRYLWKEKNIDEVQQAIMLALLLEPGCARGAPLRALGLGGVDSKFYERNRVLLTRLLDIRFAGLPTELGLETFLGAADERDHWLLVVDLDGGLLPFRQLRVRDVDLAKQAVPGSFLLIVENERCHHQLPRMTDTVAILGAGLNLNWMAANWLGTKNLAYWGDIDTWGLTMLARSRQHQSRLTPLLMTKEVFDQHSDKAVVEEVPASTLPPAGLSASESEFFSDLLTRTRGRLEQEFLPKSLVEQALTGWHLLLSRGSSNDG